MKRQKTFTVDASSVQGIEGATITFKIVKRSTWKSWRSDTAQDDESLILDHLVSWSAILGFDDKELPVPTKEDPSSLDELGYHEVPAIGNLLLEGPHGKNALKN